MRTQTVDIIDELVKELIAELVIKTATLVSGNYVIETDCTWWLSIKDSIEINGVQYIVESFVINESLTLSGSVIPPIGSYQLNIPNYIHGTLKMAQNEVDAVVNKTSLVPFVYLFEVIRDRKNTEFDSMIDRETELRIFFLNSANTGDWLTDDHYTNVINPMQQMVDLFIRLIQKNKLFTDEFSYDCLPLINVSETGTQDESVFDCNLSGIELRLSAEIREDLSCENKCKC